MEGTLIAHCGASKITREELQNLPVPESTGTFKPIPHHEVVNAVIETLGFRHIGMAEAYSQQEAPRGIGESVQESEEAIPDCHRARHVADRL